MNQEREWLTPEEFRLKRLETERIERDQLKKIRDDYNRHNEELRRKEASQREANQAIEIPVGVCAGAQDVSNTGTDCDCLQSEFSECEGTC